jgi:ribosome-binding factor A
MASLIREVVSETIANKIQDPRVSQFVSVTRVEVTGDLQIAKVFISVMGSEGAERTTLRGLENARGLVQRAVARAVTARICPQIRFMVDGSIKKASEIIALIDANVPHPPAEDETEDLADDEFEAELDDFAEDDAPPADGDPDAPPSDGVGS